VNLVYAMILSIGVKGISAIVEIAIQMLISNGVGVSGYGDYTFFVNLISGIYFFLFAGSVKLNTYYLSTPSASLSNFKKKYLLFFVMPIMSIIIGIFGIMKNRYGIVAGIILFLYYYAYDCSSVMFSRGKQLPALLGEYLFGRIVMLIGTFSAIHFKFATGIVLLAMYGLEFVTIILWLEPQRLKLPKGTDEITVPMPKLLHYQISDVANSLISYSPTILQYIVGGAFTAGFSGIISVIKKFINFISGPTAKVFLPEFSRLYKLGEKEKLEESYLMIVRVQMVFIGTISALLLGFPNLVLRLFNSELEQYASTFTLTAACLLFIAGIGPVIGVLQMTGNEKICNRNQWISIGIMIAAWLVLHKLPLFAIYGIWVQAVTEGVMNYFSVCKWFGKLVVPLKDYILLWGPVVGVRIAVDALKLTYSFPALIIGVLAVFMWNLFFAYQDKMVKASIVNLIHKGK